LSERVRTWERTREGWREIAVSTTLREASSHLPEGLYTTLRTYGGDRIVRPRAHAERLSAGGSVLAEAEVVEAVSEALGKTRYAQSRIRLTFAPPHLFVSIESFEPPPGELYSKGALCVTVDLHREQPRQKKTDFISAAAKAYAELPPGIHEGLLVGPDGAILEGLSSNVFFVLDETLRTEGDRALPGVTRSLVLEVGAEILPIRMEAVPLADVARASECFLSSVSRGILPVAQINSSPVGFGRPGERTKEMIGRFERLVAREAVRVA
jgi:branched-chain amino acid aminotransferase